MQSSVNAPNSEAKTSATGLPNLDQIPPCIFEHHVETPLDSTFSYANETEIGRIYYCSAKTASLGNDKTLIMLYGQNHKRELRWPESFAKIFIADATEIKLQETTKNLSAAPELIQISNDTVAVFNRTENGTETIKFYNSTGLIPNRGLENYHLSDRHFSDFSVKHELLYLVEMTELPGASCWKRLVTYDFKTGVYDLCTSVTLDDYLKKFDNNKSSYETCFSHDQRYQILCSSQQPYAAVITAQPTRHRSPRYSSSTTTMALTPNEEDRIIDDLSPYELAYEKNIGFLARNRNTNDLWLWRAGLSTFVRVDPKSFAIYEIKTENHTIKTLVFEDYKLKIKTYRSIEYVWEIKKILFQLLQGAISLDLIPTIMEYIYPITMQLLEQLKMHYADAQSHLPYFFATPEDKLIIAAHFKKPSTTDDIKKAVVALFTPNMRARMPTLFQSTDENKNIFTAMQKRINACRTLPEIKTILQTTKQTLTTTTPTTFVEALAAAEESVQKLETNLTTPKNKNH